MNENINLCEILKGHEGETFYCLLTGGIMSLREVKCNALSFENPFIIKTIRIFNSGAYYPGGECIIFPSKDQRDWNKWAEEQKSKVLKTWSEYIKIVPPKTNNDYKDYPFAVQNPVFKRKDITPIEKSVLALLKIHQLIEVGYGGNVTSDEWKDNKWKYCIVCDTHYSIFDIKRYQGIKQMIAFHAKEQAEEFLKYPENVQLLKNYFII